MTPNHLEREGIEANMSYIAGIVGSVDPARVQSIIHTMAAAMRHRGEASSLPLVIENGSGPLAMITSAPGQHRSATVAAVMEGEIYAAPGHDRVEPVTGSVPAKLLADRLESVGKDFARGVNGAYTAAVWDSASATLHLVRDAIGCRSLYYAPIPGGLVFASTAAAVLASGLVDRAIDPASVDSYFGVKALSPPRTLFKNVFALRAGHVLTWNSGRLDQQDYWRLHEIAETSTATAEDLRDELQQTIRDAVHIRQQAGGRYCALVSGGVDTSAVACLLNGAGGSPLHGLSIAFDELAYSDAALQDIVVKTLGVEQREQVLSAQDFADTMVKAVAHLDSPVNDAALVGMYAAFAMARADGYDVVFDGEGPDELFPAGNTHGERGIANLLRLPYPLRRALFGLVATSMPMGDGLSDRIRRMCARLALPDNERRLTWRPLCHTAVRRQLLTDAYCTGTDPYEVGKTYLAQASMADPLNLYQYGLIKTFLADDLLYKNERMASAHDLMNRTPLVDYRLAELALRIPSRFQIQEPTAANDGIKLLYKAALRGIVPDDILDRKKERGFSQPTRVWFAGPLKDFLHEGILGERSRRRGIFNTGFLQRLFDEHVSGQANHDGLLTAVLIFSLWLDRQES